MCQHCEFIEKTFGDILKTKDSTNREYWLMTEVFVYLHGSDVCNQKEICPICGESNYENFDSFKRCNCCDTKF